MTRLGISSIMGLASEADKPKKLYKTSNSEKYSRGRRGAPAKGVGRATGARVQIPLSPLFKEKNKIKSSKNFKKIVDKHLRV